MIPPDPFFSEDDYRALSEVLEATVSRRTITSLRADLRDIRHLTKRALLELDRLREITRCGVCGESRTPDEFTVPARGESATTRYQALTCTRCIRLTLNEPAHAANRLLP